MATVKVKQDDLRKLMKERREKAKLNSERIDSPIAKYNSIGQLSCSICNVNIKNNGLWGPHVAGKIHKENLSKQKKSFTGKESRNDLNIGIKRKLETTKDLKRLKSDVIPQPAEEKQPIKSSLAGYSSSSESGSDTETTASSEILPSTALPPGFFDSSETNSNTPSSSNVKPENVDNPIPHTNKVESLPEGFFDDPILDAKARNIEYKDPVEEEWERFQKTIAEETNVSKTIIEENLEESTLERDIDQIDEQIHQWERVNNLQYLADDVVKTAPKKETCGGSSGGSDEELEDDDLLNWRSKGVKM